MPERFSPSDLQERNRERVLKTVGVLPSLATLGNLACGVGAIYLCMLSMQAAGRDGEAAAQSARLLFKLPSFLSAAAYLLVLGMIFDALDGRLARLARKTTEFGAQLDSLADIVSFGVAPACLVLALAQPAIFSEMADLTRAERAWWRAEWVMAAMYVCCAALRLARFNVENEEDESSHMVFGGLPSPGAAGAVMGAVILHQELLQDFAHPTVITVLERLMPPFAAGLGLLMVSRIQYPHMVNALLRGRRPLWQIVATFVMVLIGLVVAFEVTLAVVAAIYALSGPYMAAMRRITGKPLRPIADATDTGIDVTDTFEDTTLSENDHDDEPEEHLRLRS